MPGRSRIFIALTLLAAAAGCDTGVSTSSVAWAWAGQLNSCATTYDRRLWCWGENEGSNVGDGTTDSRSVPTAPSGDLKDVTFVSLGGGDTCAVQGGRLLCWGESSGGDGDILSMQSTAVPNLQAVMPDPVAAVAVASFTKCVVKVDGSAWCWGSGGGGELGDGRAMDSGVPVAVSSLSTGVVSLLADDSGMFALKDDGSVWGWGVATGAMRGGPTQPPGSLVPVPIVRSDGSPLTGIRQIDGQGLETCALGRDGRISCWGDVSPQLLGVDHAIDVDAGDSSAAIVEIAVSDGSVCRLDTRGAVACAGRNINGELGDDSADPYRPTMGPVAGLPGRALHITAGLGHHCALVEDLTLWCWGWNDVSQLGLGDTTDRSHPARVTFQAR